jgi:hypothetical protein
MSDDGMGFLLCQDDGQLRWALDSLDAGQVIEFAIEELLVEEEQRASPREIAPQPGFQIASHALLRYFLRWAASLRLRQPSL